MAMHFDQSSTSVIERYKRYTSNVGRMRSFKLEIGFDDPEQKRKAEILMRGVKDDPDNPITFTMNGEEITVFGIPARPFIKDAFEQNRFEIDDEIRGFERIALDKTITRYQMTVAKRNLGDRIAKIVVDFVESNPYAGYLPNSKKVQAVKGADYPLHNEGLMIASIIPIFDNNYSSVKEYNEEEYNDEPYDYEDNGEAGYF